MLEKRQAVRYRVGDKTDITIVQEGRDLVGPVVDLSLGGLMTSLPESECRQLVPGQEVSGQLRRSGAVTEWRGRVVHRSPVRYGVGVGIVFEGSTAPAVVDAIKEIVEHPEAGGIHLQRQNSGFILEVVGRLSFATSRDCLAYCNRETVVRIDLSRCTSIDSAGLGMLCIAQERKIAIVGAQGAVKNLLMVARIREAEPIAG